MSVPYLPLLKGLTVLPVLERRMVNNVSRHFFSQHEVSIIYFLRAPSYRCHSCNRDILNNTIGGRGLYHEDDFYCFHCVAPTGEDKNKLYVAKVAYKLKRRTKKHPMGFVTLTDVFSDDRMEEWKKQMEQAGYPMEKVMRIELDEQPPLYE